MKRMLRLGMSLRTRLTLWYGALLALTLLAFSGLVYFTLQQSLSSSLDERLTLRADQLRREVGPSIGNFLQPEDVAPGVQLQSTLSEFVGTGVYVQLLNQKAAVIATPPNLVGEQLPVPASSRQAIAEDRPIFDTVPVQNNSSVRLLTQPLHLEGTDEVVGAVQVAESLSPLDNTMSAVSRLLLSAGAGALLLAVVVGWLLTRAALSPVYRITDTARHIAATGDYRQRLHVTPPRFGHGDELFFLAGTFNDMIARLEHMLESQRRLLADTSHELRNPITIIRGNLALLRRQNIPDSSRAEAIVEAEEEAARMGRLVGDLLLLARADTGDMASFQRERVDLGDLATEVVEQARPRATGYNLSVTCDSRCIVLGDRDRLKQLVTNLVENAIRYTPAGGNVDVRVKGAPGLQQRSATVRSRNARETGSSIAMANLTISDTGIGIASTDLPHVFERFYRADKARSRAHGGTGLGLSIAEYIVQVHGGSIEAASGGINRGSTFTVRLPLAPRADPTRPIVPPPAAVAIGR
ncbi:MAG: HAMP domain-containing protein [Chloroflexi bacterium]|nr:HAMP domain-containing protein [Chloroflexota bacterium]